MLRIDKVLTEITNGRKAQSKEAAWGCAHAAVDVAELGVPYQIKTTEDFGYPDFDDLETNLRYHLQDTNYLIESVDETIINWLKEKGIEGETKQAIHSSEAKGRRIVIIGEIPLYLAALASEVLVIEMGDMFPLECELKTARIAKYRIVRL